MAKTAKTTSQVQAPSQAKAKPRARIQVRRSGVHGKGVYALQAFEPGDFVIEYKGEHISWEEMERRHEAKEGDPFHTFFFQTESGNVIDGGGVGRNAARWINHSCEANCETQEDDDGHVFITAIAPIAPGEEFFYDYALEIDEPLTAELKNDYACRCGSANCRGTMLKTRRKAVKKSASKAAAAPAAEPAGAPSSKARSASQAPVKAKRQSARKEWPVEAAPELATKAPKAAKAPPAAKPVAKPLAKEAQAKAPVKTKPAKTAKTPQAAQKAKAAKPAAKKVPSRAATQ
ncbi:SET domain-containing protein [Lampropedia aestuarii]|uniref:SET domain-containing protein n=1 Tax=Lampropedia aestuarii TaxID=2562762 RepID=UPI002469BAC9|nr:SET domain-containing protein-lysine N-methyltransferase [Lampropedia aestuarii]MDH5856137.1 SET domain-containing protein-lysine N-methyltransferase [Lampropedia aestuarii]